MAKDKSDKNWFARHKILTVIGVFIIIGVIATASSGGSDDSSSNTVPGPGSPAASDAGGTDPSTTSETEKTWQTVATLSGNGNKRSPVFALSGGQARLKYTVNGEMVLVSIYVVKEGSSLEEDGGFPEVMATEAGSDETMLAKSAGNYYLDVTAANAAWEVVVEELR